MRIDLDRWEEIFITITRNKTRSLLTALVFLGHIHAGGPYGGGQGLQDMMSANFKGFATNSVFSEVIKPVKPIKDLEKDVIGIWNLTMWNVSAKPYRK